MICRESFSDIVAVYPFAVGDIKFQVPFNVRDRQITPKQMGVSSLDDLIKDRTYYSVGDEHESDKVIEIEERKCVVKSATKYTSAGRAFDVSLTLIINEKSTKSVTLMDEIESVEHDFIIQCVDGDMLLVRCAPLGYRCTAEEEVAEVYQQKLAVSFENINGIQRISK